MKVKTFLDATILRANCSAWKYLIAFCVTFLAMMMELFVRIATCGDAGFRMALHVAFSSNWLWLRAALLWDDGSYNDVFYVFIKSNSYLPWKWLSWNQQARLSLLPANIGLSKDQQIIVRPVFIIGSRSIDRDDHVCSVLLVRQVLEYYHGREIIYPSSRLRHYTLVGRRTSKVRMPGGW